MRLFSRRSAVVLASAGVLCLASLGGAASAIGSKGIKGDPQPEQKSFTIGTGGAGNVAILPDGSLVVAYLIGTSNDQGAVRVCVMANRGHSCTHKVTLTPFTGDDVGGVPQVFALSNDHVVVLVATCCDANSDGSDAYYTSTDGGATFGAPVRVGNVGVQAGEALDGQIVYTGEDPHLGVQVASFPDVATAPQLNIAQVTDFQSNDLGIGSYKGGVLAADDGEGSTVHVQYAPSGDPFNMTSSYTAVADFPHEAFASMSGNALLTYQTTGKDKLLLRFFNGTSFGPAHTVPGYGGHLIGFWFTIIRDPSGETHLFAETSWTSPLYDLKELSTRTGSKWTKPRDLGNAIDSNSFWAALDANGSGLVLGDDQKDIGYPVLAPQSVTFSLSKSSVKKGHKVTGKGKGSAAASGRKIELQIEKSGKWYDVASTHESASGAFKFKIKGSSTGTFKYRAVASDHAGYVEFGYSPARSLHVT